MEKLFPYALVSTASFLASVAVLFVYLRRRAGGWLALAGALPVLFMGTAREVTIWPVNIAFTAAMAAGIAALLALEGEDRRGDAIACGLLVLGLTFSELALFFAVGAAVSMVLARRPWSRAYVVVVPVLLYAAWYAGWGHTAESHLSLHNLVHSPVYLAEGLASSAWSLLGVPTHEEGRRSLAGTARTRGARGAARALTHAPAGHVLERARGPALLLGADRGQLRAGPRAGPVEIPVRGRRPASARSGERLSPGSACRRRQTLAILGVACLATIANLAVLHHHYGFLPEPRDRRTRRAGGSRGRRPEGRSQPDPRFRQHGVTPRSGSLTVGPYLLGGGRVRLPRRRPVRSQ